MNLPDIRLPIELFQMLWFHLNFGECITLFQYILLSAHVTITESQYIFLCLAIAGKFGPYDKVGGV